MSMSKHSCFLCILVISIVALVCATSDNEFAEFEDPDDVSSSSYREAPQSKPVNPDVKSSSSEKPPPSPSRDDVGEKVVNVNEKIQPTHGTPTLDPEAIVETEDDEGHVYQDNDEFEGFSERTETGKDTKQDIEIAKVPHHLTTSWDNYFLEIIMLFGLLVYFLAFLVGRAKNQRLAQAWLVAHKDILETNFSLVGDDGVNAPNNGQLRKEAEHLYSLWCSGRVCVEGMLVELKLLKRQDLVSVIAQWLKPVYDQVWFTVRMEPGEIDGFTMAIIKKKKVASMIKDYQDLAFFCGDKKMPPRPGVPDNYVVLNEISEVLPSILDPTVCKVLSEYEERIEFIHISDQYSGLKTTVDENQTTASMPKIESAIIFGLKIGRHGITSVSDMEDLRPLFKFLLYLIDRVRKIKLSKEARLKSEKNRRKAIESYQKQLHSQRQEAAQQRREEKRRLEKEKLLAEEDPDKARKMEERESKKDAKRKQPKTKMLKVKGM